MLKTRMFFFVIISFLFVFLILFSLSFLFTFSSLILLLGITGDLLDRARNYLDRLLARDREDEEGGGGGVERTYNERTYSDRTYSTYKSSSSSLGVNIPLRSLKHVDDSLITGESFFSTSSAVPNTTDDYSDDDDDIEDLGFDPYRVSTVQYVTLQ